ncbi:Branched-chain alpha-keto acid dehydrogenase E1 component alpha chain [Cladobotryum mycophilum]|uniref:2-oxoisovalerate dehydrogenase subunit alpha n=1 Tax=Cladobotryum mycophilum TaxID=491253 RepID=A0ABR0S6K2_9HYPO
MALQDGGRPVLIEAMTYRVSHHSTSDDSFAYRARVEVEDWKRRDNPLTRLRKWMEAKGCWDEAKEKEARDTLRKDILKAFGEAEREKKPPIRTMFEDVYEDLTEDLLGQMKQLKDMLDKYPNDASTSSAIDNKFSLTLLMNPVPEIAILCRTYLTSPQRHEEYGNITYSQQS